MSKRLDKKKFFLKTALVFAGLFLLFAPELKKAIKKSTTEIQPIVEVQISLPSPTRIRVPDVSIDLEVKPAMVSANNWQLYDDSASFLISSARPGEKGNTVIYTHNTNNLFGPLRWSEIGDQILVETKEATTSYTISEIKTVPPTQIDIVAPALEETLTLFTCTNFQDADRLVIIAKPIL